MSQYGIKETGELLVLVCGLIKFTGDHLLDGFQMTEDIPGLLAPLLKATPALEGLSLVPAEYGDLDQDEKGELLKIVDAELGDGKAEVIGEQVIAVALSVGVILKALKA